MNTDRIRVAEPPYSIRPVKRFEQFREQAEDLAETLAPGCWDARTAHELEGLALDRQPREESR